MIGKVITKKKGTPSSIKRLNAYIMNEGGRGNGEHKVMFSGTKNINCPARATEEMEAVASMNKYSKNPVMHCLLSWRQGEMPSEEQAKRAVGIALDELGLSANQCVWALHKDTDNYHLHISVNRVEMRMFRAIDAGGGWPKKAMERAARRVEYEQGWQVEKNAWTSYSGDRAPQETKKQDITVPALSQSASDAETQNGEKSAARILKEALKDKKYTSWDDLHKGLAELGFRYEKKGTGAVIFVGDEPIKASAAGKRFALTYLEKKFGEYILSAQQTKPNDMGKHISEPTEEAKHFPYWQEYIEERNSYYASKRAAKDDMTMFIARDKKALLDAQKRERDYVFRGQESFRGRREELNAIRASLGAKHRAEREAQKQEHRERREEYKEKYCSRFPSFETWLRERGNEREAERWRHRASFSPIHSISLEPASEIAADMKKPGDMRGFRFEIQKGGSILYYARDTEQCGFADTGKKITLFSRDDSSMIAALQLASQKWGTVQINGTDEYKQLCLVHAVQNGIKISNPELQDDYARLLAEKKEREAQTPQSLKALADFRRYHDAVGADRYAVTATKIFNDGNKRGFMVNRRDGAPDGFTSFEMAQRMGRIINLEEREGRNIYYTPISDKKYHILIDDLTRASLDRLRADGFSPAVVIETSPNNWQVVITVPKPGTERDREVGNILTTRLNKLYGDPKLSGATHAHRAPGFRNMKPKHRAGDGTYPPVRLISAQKIVCEKAARLAREIAIELADRRRAESHWLESVSKDIYIEEETVNRAAKAFELHFKDMYRIVKQKEEATGLKTDISRIDSAAAVRLRATGHSRECVQAAIEIMAPRLREAVGDGGTHIWPDYARRTAEYAFSYTGEMEVERLKGKYLAYWQNIDAEARRVVTPPMVEPVKQPEPEPEQKPELRPEREKKQEQERVVTKSLPRTARRPVRDWGRGM